MSTDTNGTASSYGQYDPARPPAAPARRTPPDHAAPAPYSLGAADADELDALGVRIRFGDRDNQTMPASWAAGVLAGLVGRNPVLFGQLLAEVATGTARKPRAVKPRAARNPGELADDGN